jgi:hypothetical protein
VVSAIVTGSLLPERRAVRRHDEDEFHRATVTYLRLAVPDAVVWHTPNGGLRHPKEAARLKGLGVLAGFPDLAVWHRGNLYLLELKAARGVLSAAQRETQHRLAYNGAAVVTCKTLEGVECSLRELGLPLRASINQ